MGEGVPPGPGGGGSPTSLLPARSHFQLVKNLQLDIEKFWKKKQYQSQGIGVWNPLYFLVFHHFLDENKLFLSSYLIKKNGQTIGNPLQIKKIFILRHYRGKLFWTKFGI